MSSMRRVNALNGNVAPKPSGFFKALSEADAFVAERDTRAELEIRCLELEQENAELKAELRQLKTKQGRRGW